MPKLIKVVKRGIKPNSVVVVVKGFLARTREESDFSEFSFVPDEFPDSDVIGYDWESGTWCEVAVTTGFSYAFARWCNKIFFPDSKPSAARHILSLAIPAFGHLYRVWRKAIKNTESFSNHLRASLESIQEVYPNVIIVAHSLGCRLLLNALERGLERKAERIILVAGAIEERDNNLHRLVRSAGYVENRYTKSDLVLMWLYRLAEFRLSANPVGITRVSNKSIVSIDCSETCFGHGLTSHVEPMLRQALAKL